MKNIDYLECFFKKHSLSGKVTVRYTSRVVIDDYMSEVEFENGDIIGINDIIFDIDSDLPADVAEQWMVSKKENDISLSEWIQTNTHYLPKSLMDRSSIENYQREMEDLFDDVKKTIDSVFNRLDDNGDSESEDD